MSLFFSRKYWYFINGFAIIVVIFLLIALIRFSNQFILKDVPLGEQGINEFAGLLAAHTQTETTSSLRVYRLMDAKEEVFDGGWQLSFASPSEMYLYGQLSEDEQTQRLFVLNVRGGHQKDISALPGPIISIAENRAATYLLVSGIVNESKGEFYTCVTEKRMPVFDSCLSIGLDIVPPEYRDLRYTSFWNQSTERDMVILPIGTTSTHQLFVYDPWQEAPYAAATSTVSYFNAHPALAEGNRHPLFVNNPSRILHARKIGPFISFTNDRTGVRRTFLTRADDVLIVTDKHALIRERNDVFVINIQERTKSHFATLADKSTTLHTFYSWLEGQKEIKITSLPVQQFETDE